MTQHRLAQFLLLATLQLAVCVLASLLGVWLLSQAVGFRFFPTLVAGLSGSFVAANIAMRRRAAVAP